MADAVRVSLTVNGRERTAEVEPRMLLVHFLRDTLGLTGTHVGCDTTQCGCCTVDLDGKAVKSCTVLALSCDGANVTTIEGLSENGTLHPMQEAFREHHGLQCGFCTPGMMATGRWLIEKHPNPTQMTDHEIRDGISGNLCRCTGYDNIIKAIRWAAAYIEEHPESARTARQ